MSLNNVPLGFSYLNFIWMKSYNQTVWSSTACFFYSELCIRDPLSYWQCSFALIQYPIIWLYKNALVLCWWSCGLFTGLKTKTNAVWTCFYRYPTIHDQEVCVYVYPHTQFHPAVVKSSQKMFTTVLSTKQLSYEQLKWPSRERRFSKLV